MPATTIARIAAAARCGRRALLAAGAGLALLAALPIPAAAQSRNVLVFAAASLKDALDDVAAQYRQQHDRQAVISSAASPAVARQTGAGAPADLGLSADLALMGGLAQRDLIPAATPGNL